MTSLVTNTLHLYRSLLRETTYLFDADVRAFCHKYVVSSFRHHATPRAPKRETFPFGLLPSRVEFHRLKRGRKFLYMLERATHGHLAAVEKILKLTYGRRGKRRRQLMSEIMTPELADPMTEGCGSVVDIRSRDWRPPRSFTALARAQSRVQSYFDRSREVKLSSSIPEKNKWGRTMPKCRVKNMNKKWYARNADILLPPLPESEWRDIYDKASGRKEIGGRLTRQRRPQGLIGILTQDMEPYDVEAENNAVILARGVSKIPGAAAKSPRDINNLQGKRGHNPHRLTPRFLRRRVMRAVLRYTPLAKSRGEGKSLAYRWEEGTVSRRIPKQANESQINSLFD